MSRAVRHPRGHSSVRALDEAAATEVARRRARLIPSLVAERKVSMKSWLPAAICFAFLLVVAAANVHAEDQQVNIYNWADYIGKNTIAKFEQATGIKIVYDTFDADTMLEAKVMAGGSDYDVVTTSTEFFSRQIKAGVYMTLDKKKLPNWKNLDPHILAIEAGFDPGNMHAVPYMHSINGFAYNVDMIKERMPNAPLDSLDITVPMGRFVTVAISR